MTGLRFEAHQCQRCGADIGYLGRGLEALPRLAGFSLHHCEPVQPPLGPGEVRIKGTLPEELTRLERGTWWANLLGKIARAWRRTRAPTSIDDYTK